MYKINLTVSNQHTSIKAIQFIEKNLSVEFIGINRVNDKLITLEFLWETYCDNRPIMKAKLTQIVENNTNKIKDMYRTQYIYLRAFSIQDKFII